MSRPRLHPRLFQDDYVRRKNGFVGALLRRKWALCARSRALAVFRSLHRELDRRPARFGGVFPVVAVQKRPLLYGGCEFSIRGLYLCPLMPPPSAASRSLR